MRELAPWVSLAVLALSAPFNTQSETDPPPNTAKEGNTEDRIVIDILAKPLVPPSSDAALARQCEEQREAAVISGEIVVCRKLGDDARYSGVDSEAAARRYAERTQGPGTPNVEGAGGSILYRGEGSVFMVTTGKIKVGAGGKETLIVDVEALPEAPEGSDADRVGKGLSAQADGGP